ncbi:MULTISPECIES: tetratricopeptide repeat protein [Bacteroidales]|uniref:tetratricopeptide repeat protein n=1 Tax=Bacteroidales TaxID=171549 RepID=UPI0013CFC1CE|nr:MULTISPECIES: hypothetical protein [Bacteroidales]
MQKNRLDAKLKTLECYISSNPDSIKYELEKINTETLDEINNAYHNILLVEAGYYSGFELVQYDSTLNASIDILKNTKYKRAYAKALFYKGIIWDYLEIPQEAIKSYFTALDLVKDKDYELISSLYSALGNVYLDQELYEDAINAFRSGYYKTLTGNNFKSIYTNARNLGIGFFLVEKPDSSYHYLKKAYGYANMSSDSVKLKDLIYNDLGLYFSEKDNYDEALKYMKKISKMTDNYHLNLGCIYAATGDWDLAIENLVIAIESTDLGIRTVALKQLSRVEENFGSYENSLVHLHDFLESYDSLTIKTKTGEIYAINQIHNIDKELIYINNKHKSFIIMIVSCSIIIILIIILIAVYTDKKKKIKQANELLVKEKKIMENEKDIINLQNQISETKNTILKLKYENQNLAKDTQDNLVKEKEESIAKMEKQINHLRILLFYDKPIYKKIRKFDNQKDSENINLLPLKDRIELFGIIKNVYSDLFENLKTNCPSLTEEDLIFCCLSKMNFNLPLICACTGYPRTASARQRRYRIKKKMIEHSANENLYNFIFQP